MLLTVIASLFLAKLSSGNITVDEQTHIRLDQVRHPFAPFSTTVFPKYTLNPIVRTITPAPNGTVLEESVKQPTTAAPTVINVMNSSDMTSTSSTIPPPITTTLTINPATPTAHTRKCGSFTAGKRCMTKDAAAHCVMVDGQPHCVCSEEWSGKFCISKIQAAEMPVEGLSATAVDRIFFFLFGAVIVLSAIIILIIEDFAVTACFRRCSLFKQREQEQHQL